MRDLASDMRSNWPAAAHAQWLLEVPRSQLATENGMIVPRTVCLLVGLFAALSAVLCFGPGAWSVAHVLTTLACASVAMPTAMVGALLGADWQADEQSRYDWAQLGLTPAQLSLPVELPPASNFDPRYLAAESDEALRHVFLTHRAAAQAARRVSIPAPPDELTSVQPVRDQGSGTEEPSPAEACERILQDLESTPTRAARTSHLRKGEGRTEDTASRLRLVANGDTWPDWQQPSPSRADKVADVIVLSDRRREQAQAPPQASIASESAKIAAQPACRGPPRLRASRSGVPADPVVRDNRGQRLPIGRAEPRLTSTCPAELANLRQSSHSGRHGHEGARNPNDVIADLARLLGRLAARLDFEAEEAEHARRHLRQVQQRSTEPDVD